MLDGLAPNLLQCRLVVLFVLPFVVNLALGVNRRLARLGNFDGTGSDDLAIGLDGVNSIAGAVFIVKGGSSFASITIPDATNAIEIDGTDILRLPRHEQEQLRSRIGMLFQNGALFDSLPVWENVVFGLLAQRRLRRSQGPTRAAEFLTQVGLAASVGSTSAFR